MSKTLQHLLQEALAVLDTFADVAPAVSLRADMREALAAAQAPAQPSQNKERSMSEWFDSDNNIIVDTLPELMSAANTRQFGETKAETLTRFLMCEAFERRYVPEEALAFRLAAMIISRIETQPAAPGTAGDS